MDGRAFIKKAVHDLSIETNDSRTFDHFIMNLPATAIEFLGMFVLSLLIQSVFFFKKKNQIY